MAWLEREREVRETMISVTKGEIIYTKTNKSETNECGRDTV